MNYRDVDTVSVWEEGEIRIAGVCVEYPLWKLVYLDRRRFYCTTAAPVSEEEMLG